MPAEAETRRRILDASADIVAEAGVTGLTFEAIARRLGVTKQAVIYWFPTKQDLARELVVPLIRAEAAATVAALGDARNAADAIAHFVRALVDFHRGDLGRFRLMYLAVQVNPRPDLLLPQEAMQRHVHPVTGEMYAALEVALGADPAFRTDLPPRRAAAVVHMAALGLITMVSMADAVDDPLAHATDDLVATLVALLTGGVRG